MADLLHDKAFNRAWMVAMAGGLLAAMGATGWWSRPWESSTVFGVLLAGCVMGGVVERPLLRDRVTAALAWLVGGVAFLGAMVLMLEVSDRFSALHLAGAALVAALPYLLARSSLEGGRRVAFAGALAFVVLGGAAISGHLGQERIARDHTELVLEVKENGEVWSRGIRVEDVAATLSRLPHATRLVVTGEELSVEPRRASVNAILAEARQLGLNVTLD